jgi:hypothetical protein
MASMTISIVPPPPPNPTVEEQIAHFQEMKKRFGLYSGAEATEVAATVGAPIIEGLIPAGSVNLLVGDSGLGNTPLVYQLALSVAAGCPFLDFAVKPSRVLMVDYENPLEDATRMLEQQRQNLALDRYPVNFLLWPFHLAPSPVAPELELEKAIRWLTPELLILDSLRAYCAKMEGDSRSAAQQINSLRQHASRYGAAVLLVHHVRKGHHRRRAHLETTPALEWLLEAAGSRALVNQSDVRLAVALPRTARDEQAGLVLRGHYRTRGEIGPFLLRRRRDAAGNPVGYDREALPRPLLDDPDQEAAYHRLPQVFGFAGACQSYGRSRGTTHRFLVHLMDCGLLRREEAGRYRKVEKGAESRARDSTAPGSNT